MLFSISYNFLPFLSLHFVHRQCLTEEELTNEFDRICSAFIVRCVCVCATWLRALVPSPKSLLGLPSWSITEFSTKKVRQKEREVERGSERGRKGEREVERGSELILWLLLWKLISVIRLTTFGATDSLPRRHKRTRSTHLVSRLAC